MFAFLQISPLSNSILPKYQNIDYRKEIKFISHKIQFTNESLIFAKNIGRYWYLI